MKFYINRKIWLLVIFMMLPFHVFAAVEKNDAEASRSASTALSADPMSSSYLIQLIAGLFVVLISIVVLAWIAKKVNRFRFIADDSLKIIGGLSMGARERVVLMQVGDSQLLIGIAPGRINTLHVLDTPIRTTDMQSGESSGRTFSNKLKAMMVDASSSKHSVKQDKP